MSVISSSHRQQQQQQQDQKHDNTSSDTSEPSITQNDASFQLDSRKNCQIYDYPSKMTKMSINIMNCDDDNGKASDSSCKTFDHDDLRTILERRIISMKNLQSNQTSEEFEEGHQLPYNMNMTRDNHDIKNRSSICNLKLVWHSTLKDGEQMSHLDDNPLKHTHHDLPDYIQKIINPSQTNNTNEQLNNIYEKKTSNIDIIAKRVPPGMPNLGNTCYLNASLQCILHLLDNYWLKEDDYIIDQHHHDDHHQYDKNNNNNNSKFESSNNSCINCMMCQIKILWQKRHKMIYKTSNNFNGQLSNKKTITKISPYSIYNIAKKVNSKAFGNGKQADSHEFFCLVVNQMLQNICGSKLDFAFEQRTQLFKLFGGFLNSNLSCRSCTYQNSTYDPFINLSIDIPSLNSNYGKKTHSLMSCIDGFFSSEIISPLYGYKCEKCKLPSEATKQYQIKIFPKLLVIHLKRFTPISKTMQNTISYSKANKNIHKPMKFVKNNIHLYFPEFLDLSKYITKASSSHSESTNDNKLNFDNNIMSYRLDGLIIHHGSSINSGHYTCKIHQNNDTWFDFDDESVRSCTKDSVFNSNPYILIYKKLDKNISNKHQTDESIQDSSETSKNLYQSKNITKNDELLFSDKHNTEQNINPFDSYDKMGSSIKNFTNLNKKFKQNNKRTFTNSCSQNSRKNSNWRFKNNTHK